MYVRIQMTEIFFKYFQKMCLGTFISQKLSEIFYSSTYFYLLQTTERTLKPMTCVINDFKFFIKSSRNGTPLPW